MSQLTILDIALRFLCLGQLVFFLLWVLVQSAKQRRLTFEHGLLCGLLICCMGAVIFTMHYRPELMYALRPIFLALTDGLPFFLWVYVVLSLSDAQSYFRRSCWLKIVGVGYLIWHLYYFIIHEGAGWFHDVVHVSAALALLHVIYHCVVTWQDDLVDSRRRRRAIFLVAACAIMAMYVLGEISGTRFMRSEFGSLIGASAILLLSLSSGVFYFLGLLHTSIVIDPQRLSGAISVHLKDIPSQQRGLYQRLNEFMNRQEFTESRLTLPRLAEHLDSKEHRLRSLINQSLGYRNFSNYLNDYRLPLACDWLKNKPEMPITDIALAVGYGSITSFNRAFKSKYKATPKAYRISLLQEQ